MQAATTNSKNISSDGIGELGAHVPNNLQANSTIFQLAGLEFSLVTDELFSESLPIAMKDNYY
jgi:hypothetical protein